MAASIAAAVGLLCAVAAFAVGGPNTLSAAKFELVHGDYPYPVGVADLNGDGHKDIVVGSENGDLVSILYGKKNGFKPYVDEPAGDDPFGIAIHDLNGDRRPDIAVAADGAPPESISILIAKKGGGFRPFQSYPTDSPYYVQIADMNRDGKPDLLAANNNDGTVSVLLGRGDGTFKTQKTYPTDDDPTALAVGDFTGDGKLDVAVAAHDAGGVNQGLDLLAGDGHGHLGVAKPFTAGPDAGYGIVAGQFTPDHRLDVAEGTCVSTDPASVYLFAGKKHGGLKPVKVFPDITGTCAYEMAAGDINGDGRADIVSAADTDPNSGAISVLFQKKSGGFSAGKAFPAVEQAYSAAVSDLNGDGRQDVVVPDFATANTAILYGKKK